MEKNEQPKAKVIEHPVLDPTTGFDYRVHIKDAKTGRLIRIQDYARHSKGEEVLIERPRGSGNCFYENGAPAGRYKFEVKGKETVWTKLSDDHVEVAAAPANREEQLEQALTAAQAELAAMKAEAEGKAAAKAPAAAQVQKK